MSSQEHREADRDRLWSPCVIPSHPQPHLTLGTTFQFHGSLSKDGNDFIAVCLAHLCLQQVPKGSICILFLHEIMDLGHNSLKMSIWLATNLKRDFFFLCYYWDTNMFGCPCRTVCFSRSLPISRFISQTHTSRAKTEPQFPLKLNLRNSRQPQNLTSDWPQLDHCWQSPSWLRGSTGPNPLSL